MKEIQVQDKYKSFMEVIANLINNHLKPECNIAYCEMTYVSNSPSCSIGSEVLTVKDGYSKKTLYRMNTMISSDDAIVVVEAEADLSNKIKIIVSELDSCLSHFYCPTITDLVVGRIKT